MKVVRTNHTSEDFQKLVPLLDAELAIRDGEDHAFYHQFNGIDKLNHVVVVYFENKAVGCGAFKKRNPLQVEIKRMFVLPAERKKGFASAVLTNLEKWAAEIGFEEVILETGKAQVEALSFYPKHGFVVISNFAPYEGIENSVCFKKRLV